jgi:hypothetical protein
MTDQIRPALLPESLKLFCIHGRSSDLSRRLRPSRPLFDRQWQRFQSHLQNSKTKTPKANKLEFEFSIIGISLDLQQRVLLPIFPNIWEHGIPFSDLFFIRTSAPFMR